jgi:hypothetical protein
MTPQNPESLFRITKSNALFYALVGIFVWIFSLNGVLKKIAGIESDSLFNQSLFGLATLPEKLYTSAPGGKDFLFELLVRWLFFSVVIFLLLLLFNSLRLKSAAILCSGVGGLSLGVFLFTWVSLVIYLIIIIFFIIQWLFIWIYYLLSTIFSAILALILWSPVFYGLIGLGLLFGIVLIISSFEELWRKLIEFIKSNSILNKLLAGILGLPVLVGTIYLIVKMWQLYLQPLIEIIKNWLNYYIVPVIGWIFWIIAAILGVILITALLLVTLLILGYQYCDQFFQAKNCGRSTHKAFDTGFAMGVVIAVVFLVCSTDLDYQSLVNEAWNSTMPFQTDNLVGVFHTFMPLRIETLLQSLFVNPSLPIFDVASVVIAFFLANCSLVMSLISGTTKEPLSALFRLERLPMMFLLVFGALLVIVVPIIDSIAGDDR